MMAQTKLCTLMLILALAAPSLGGCRADSPEARSAPTAETERSKEAATPSGEVAPPASGSQDVTAVPTVIEQAAGQATYPGVVRAGSAPVLGGEVLPPAVSTVSADAQPVRVAQVIKDLVAGENSYGQLLVVENPNPDLAMQDTQCRLTSYDSGGAVLETGDFKIGLLFPGERRTIYVSNPASGSTPAARLEFMITEQGSPAVTSLTSGSLSSERVKYWSESGQVTGIARNDSDYLIEMPLVTALLYDAQGKVIGVGKEQSPVFIPPKDEAGLSVRVPAQLEVARAELLVVPQGAWTISPILGDHSTLRVGRVMMWQSATDDRIGDAVVFVSNPNADRGIGGQPFQVTAFDAQGFALATQTSGTPIVFPGEKMAVIAGRFSIPAGSSIADGEAQVSPLTQDDALLDFRALGIEGSPFSVTDVQYTVQNTTSHVTGVLKNSWKKPMTQPVRVVAVAYDDVGEIVGYGSNSVFDVPANGQVNVDIGMTMAVDYSGIPARIETYASTNNLADFRLEP